jgi:hypothetical protein
MEDERENVQDIKERLVRIETLLEVNNKDLFNRIKKLEDNQSWLIKSVAVAIIGGIVALYFK